MNNNLNEKTSNRLKHFVSKSLWRFQKSSTVINLVFFTATIGGLYAQYFPNIEAKDKPSILLLLYVISFSSILGFGWLYDRVLRLWKEEAVTETERNQYQINCFTMKEIDLIDIDVTQNKCMYESMRTNMLICDHYGIEYGNLQYRLENLNNDIKTLSEWQKAGHITTDSNA